MEQLKELANLLFKDIDKTPEYYYEKYPKRELTEGARVTRFAPSPTGFVHIGGLYSALISERNAHQSKGVFYLRIEDTDKKREIEDGITGIVESLRNFSINNDEGFVNSEKEQGNYGPYKQSERMEIYQTFIKYLISEGKAYPCFASPEELEAMRNKQEAEGINPGYYGQWAIYRDKSLEEIKVELDAGKKFVVRLKSPGEAGKKVSYKDLIKGNIEMPENDQDLVICKSDGLPTYHFAHVVDDYLMGTTHVIRGDEWLSSIPIHLQLFRVLNWKAPKYAHIPTIMKNEGSSKRKLSKRKDPEAAVSFYHEEGYPIESVLEYLLNLANSNFEDWRKVNASASLWDFPFKLEKMGVSGALFDLVKLTDISKNVISTIPAEKVYQELKLWSEKFDTEFFNTIVENQEKTIKFLGIDRTGKKPRKDISKWSDIKSIMSYMFDSNFENYEFSETMEKDEVKRIISEYIKVYNHNDNKEEWFNRAKDMSETLGYAKDTKAYKENPDQYKGSVTDTTLVIRVAITGRKQTPDLYEIMQALGEEEVLNRLNNIINPIIDPDSLVL
jgi:glutamyl-tRNA synthetase